MGRSDGDDAEGPERAPRRAIWLVVGAVLVLAVVALVALEPWTPLTEEKPDPFAGSGVPADVRREMDAVADEIRQGSEDPPAPDPTEIGRDDLEGRSGVSVEGGDVVLIETSDGARHLRLEGLDLDNGPGLRLQLSTLPADAPSGELGSSNVDLGELRFTLGDANYPLSPDLDLGAYRSVVIWSNDLALPYAVAALPYTPPPEPPPDQTTTSSASTDSGATDE